eukprot:491228_1
MANVLKSLESKTINEWKNDLGIQVRRLWCFRQGGDEFCLVVHGEWGKEGTQQKVYETLKKEISKTRNEWNNLGIQVKRLWCFRQGGDEFCLVVHGNWGKEGTQQKVYETLKKEISKIKIENMENKKHLTI